jgi:hypothetical protein
MDRLRRYRISVEEYRWMAEAGVFQPEARVELIEGEILERPRRSPAHDYLRARLQKVLERRYGDLALVATQDLLRSSGGSTGRRP